MTVTVTHNDPFIDVTRGPYNARGDGSHDDLSALDDAAAAAAAVDGILFFPGGEYAISGPFDVPANVSIAGTGMRTSVIKATHASAALTSSAFSNVQWSDIGFDGNDLSTVGVEVHVGSNGGGMRNVRVFDCVGTNGSLRLHNVQNAHFDNIEVTSNTSGLWVDDGCGSLVFTALKSNENEYWQLKIGSSGAEASGYTEPTAITFVAPMLEWEAGGATANAVATVVVIGGERILFLNPIITAPGGQTEPALALATVAPNTTCRVQITGAAFIGGATDKMITLGAASALTFTGANYIAGASVGVHLSTADALLLGDMPTLASVTTARTFAGGSSENKVQRLQANQTVHTATASTDRVDLVAVTGEAGMRFQRSADGRLEWNDGSDYSPDTNLYRALPGFLVTDGTLAVVGKLLAHTGIGVGNSAAATTPGSVTKKIEVFDANGTSIGYLAVYSSIA